MTLLIDTAIRSSVMLAAGLLLNACLARRSAALRHRVLVTALLTAVLVLPFNLALPEWTVTVPAPAIDRSTSARSAIRVETPIAVPAPSIAAVSTGDETGSRVAASSVTSSVVIAWLAGLLAAMGALLTGLVRAGRLASRASPIVDPQWLEILDEVARRYGVTRGIAIVRTDATNILATWGILRPQVLVPAHAERWPIDRVRVVLAHELAHIRRHDWPVQLTAETLRAVLWFNPLAWIVCTRLRRESEQACDDEVLATGVGASAYAAHLIELARQCRRPGGTRPPVLPMAHPSTLQRRIAAMLNPQLDRRVPSWRALATLGILALLVSVPVASLRARQAGPAPLTGTIYDVSGAVLPGVRVTLVDANQVTSTAATDASGHFEFPAVRAGKYWLEATLTGFRTLRHELELQDVRDWDRAITLQVGELKETVIVAASRAPAAQAPSATAPQPVRVGGNVRAPKKIKDVRPVYPASMREAGRSGVVPIEAVIGRDGLVSSVRVVSAQVHPDFAIAAVDAVRQWQFTPTLLNGQPVEVVMSVSITFDIEK